MASDTTFQAALPYGVSTAAVAVAGVAGCFMALSSIAPITAVACGVFALMGVYGFIGVVICGVSHAGNPNGFRDNVWTALGVSAGAALYVVVEFIVKVVIAEAIGSFFRRRV